MSLLYIFYFCLQHIWEHDQDEEDADEGDEDNVQVKKIECTAHVQKRMGTRLRNKKKELSKKKLSDGKTIAGQGRLTDKMIDKIAG